MPDSPTIAVLIDRALAAFGGLVSVAAPVADELQYVADLETVWSARLRAVAETRGTEVAGADVADAIAALAEEAARIEDPHRAIDWLSTLPQVALAALAEAA
jgi:hypothetical protein